MLLLVVRRTFVVVRLSCGASIALVIPIIGCRSASKQKNTASSYKLYLDHDSITIIYSNNNINFSRDRPALGKFRGGKLKYISLYNNRIKKIYWSTIELCTHKAIIHQYLCSISLMKLINVMKTPSCQSMCCIGKIASIVH